MMIPLQATRRHIEQSNALDADIRARADRPEALFDRIVSRRVLVEPSHRHHHKGNSR